MRSPIRLSALSCQRFTSYARSASAAKTADPSASREWRSTRRSRSSPCALAMPTGWRSPRAWCSRRSIGRLLILTRRALPTLDRNRFGAGIGLARGATCWRISILLPDHPIGTGGGRARAPRARRRGYAHPRRQHASDLRAAGAATSRVSAPDARPGWQSERIGRRNAIGRAVR